LRVVRGRFDDVTDLVSGRVQIPTIVVLPRAVLSEIDHVTVIVAWVVIIRRMSSGIFALMKNGPHSIVVTTAVHETVDAFAITPNISTILIHPRDGAVHVWVEINCYIGVVEDAV